MHRTPGLSCPLAAPPPSTPHPSTNHRHKRHHAGPCPPTRAAARRACRALLRCHPPPNMHKMVELSRTAAELGFELDTSGAGAPAAYTAALAFEACPPLRHAAPRCLPPHGMHCFHLPSWVSHQAHAAPAPAFPHPRPPPHPACRPAAALVVCAAGGGVHRPCSPGGHHAAGHKAHAGKGRLIREERCRCSCMHYHVWLCWLWATCTNAGDSLGTCWARPRCKPPQGPCICAFPEPLGACKQLVH